jgi:hypothetical protein
MFCRGFSERKSVVHLPRSGSGLEIEIPCKKRQNLHCHCPQNAHANTCEFDPILITSLLLVNSIHEKDDSPHRPSATNQEFFTRAFSALPCLTALSLQDGVLASG